MSNEGKSKIILGEISHTKTRKNEIGTYGYPKNTCFYYRMITMRRGSLNPALRTKLGGKTAPKKFATIESSSNREISKVLGLLVFE